MTCTELIKSLQRLKVETESIACLGCGHEHNCGIHGCAIIREAAERLGNFNAVFNEDAVLTLASRFLKVEPGRLRELAEADKDGRVVVLPCKVGDRLYEVTGRKTISVYKVKAIRVELFSLFIEWDIVEGFVWQSLSGINAGEIGKTVFLTREEAEKALEGKRNE